MTTQTLRTPTLWRFFIPGWRPTSLNAAKSYWAQYAAKKKTFDTLMRAFLAFGVTPATGRRRVSLTIVLEGKQKPYDDDNWGKLFHDPLKWTGAIFDDSKRWLESVPIEYERGEVGGTWLTIEEIA